MAFNLPFGFDSADGKTPLPPQPQGSTGSYEIVGTPPPVGEVTVNGNGSDGNPTIENEPDSPIIERAEQATAQGRLKMAWSACLAFLPLIGRGTFVTDSFGNVWRILSSQIQRFRSGQTMGTLSYTAESISFDSPPDEYQMVPVELGINIIQHPRYFYALYPTPNDFNTNVKLSGSVAGTMTTVANIKQTIIRAIQTYQDSPYFPSPGALQIFNDPKENIINQIVSSKLVVTINNVQYTYDNTVGTVASISMALAAAGEIIQKLWYQLDTPYLVGFQVTWSRYYFKPVYMNPGGYIESPLGIVPDYFMSPTQDFSTTIFDEMPLFNPQCYSDDGTSAGEVDISWLRKSDEVEYQRTWFRVTSTWIGSPIGNWDKQLFSEYDAPDINNYNDISFPGHYLPLVATTT